MAKLISKTYGDALFETAMEKQCIDSIFLEAKTVLDALQANPDFGNLMNHPKILKEEKLQVLEEVFKGRVSDEMTGFMTIVIKKDRFAEMEEIFNYFISKVKEYKKIGVAYITTPLAMNEIQKANVKERLLATTPYEEMEIHYEVEEDLIGGMVIRIGDRVVDSSIRTKLEELKRQLLKVQIS